MWNNLMRRWMEIALWWLPKADDDRSADSTDQPASEPEAAPHPQASESPAATEAPAPEATTADDDLTAIRGIGPAMQKRLVAMGIHTHADLAAADVDTLTERLKADKAVVSRDQVRRWVDTAGG